MGNDHSPTTSTEDIAGEVQRDDATLNDSAKNDEKFEPTLSVELLDGDSAEEEGEEGEEEQEANPSQKEADKIALRTTRTVASLSKLYKNNDDKFNIKVANIAKKNNPEQKKALAMFYKNIGQLKEASIEALDALLADDVSDEEAPNKKRESLSNSRETNERGADNLRLTALEKEIAELKRENKTARDKKQCLSLVKKYCLGKKMTEADAHAILKSEKFNDALNDKDLKSVPIEKKVQFALSNIEPLVAKIMRSKELKSPNKKAPNSAINIASGGGTSSTKDKPKSFRDQLEEVFERYST